MSDRIQLNDQMADDVVGGSFNFYKNSAGEWKCMVTGFGTYESTSTGFFQYITIRNQNPGKSEAEYVELCKNAGIIW